MRIRDGPAAVTEHTPREPFFSPLSDWLHCSRDDEKAVLTGLGSQKTYQHLAVKTARDGLCVVFVCVACACWFACLSRSALRVRNARPESVLCVCDPRTALTHRMPSRSWSFS